MIIRKRDALDTLNKLDDDSADLILLDPFYNEWDSWVEKGLIELAMTKLKDNEPRPTILGLVIIAYGDACSISESIEQAGALASGQITMTFSS